MDGRGPKRTRGFSRVLPVRPVIADAAASASGERIGLAQAPDRERPDGGYASVLGRPEVSSVTVERIRIRRRSDAPGATNRKSDRSRE